MTAVLSRLVHLSKPLLELLFYHRRVTEVQETYYLPKVTQEACGREGGIAQDSRFFPIAQTVLLSFFFFI